MAATAGFVMLILMMLRIEHLFSVNFPDKETPTRPPILGVAIEDRDTETKKSEYLCKNAFIDVGSNRGDSIYKFLDSVNSGPATGALSQFFKMKKWNPKDFCVIGFEGNPYFNETLLNLVEKEKARAKMFKVYLQTVVASKSGQITFYLDTVNKQNNFWGSSLLEHHWDVVRSHKASIVADAVNLGEFAREHVDPAGILIVKMDIEGGEYDVMRQLASAGHLCYRDEQGNLLFDFMNVEFHHIPITARKDPGTPTREQYVAMMTWMMTSCGIEYSSFTD
jgi:FkbM family methyltransferase